MLPSSGRSVLHVGQRSGKMPSRGKQGKASRRHEAWRRRLYLPSYTVLEAARLVQVHRNTLSSWYAARPSWGGRGQLRVLDQRQPGASLSYMDLVEAAFVAGFRSLNVSLSNIRVAHDHLRKHFRVDYPFAQLKLQTEGKHVLYELSDKEAGEHLRSLFRVEASRIGQLVWAEPIEHRFMQFDYDPALGLAIRWFPRGRSCPVVVDPQIQFGEPVLKDSRVPTWVIRSRWSAEEPLGAIAEDFGIELSAIRHALIFEGVAESAIAA